MVTGLSDDRPQITRVSVATRAPVNQWDPLTTGTLLTTGAQVTTGRDPVTAGFPTLKLKWPMTTDPSGHVPERLRASVAIGAPIPTEAPVTRAQ